MAEHRGTIVVVDDSTSIRRMLTDLLTAEGHQVKTANDGQECLALLAQGSADLIVSDIEMPKMDGLELCRRVKADPVYRQIYFILLTTKSGVEDKVRGLNLGADDFIVKSTHRHEFLARVQVGLRLRSLEQELTAAQQSLFLAEKQAAVGKLAAGMAHEINNPIGFVTSNLVTLDKYIDRCRAVIELAAAPVPEGSTLAAWAAALAQKRRELKLDFVLRDAKELIGESLEGVRRVKEVVENLKSFAKIDEALLQEVDLHDCLDATWEVLGEEITSHVTLVKKYGRLPRVRCYPQQINQVFYNVLLNACQAMEEFGTITVATGWQAGFAMVAIADSGPGMASGVLARVFEPFFTTREVGQGVGLGLSTAFDIMKNHAGTIAVASQVGQGTTVTVRLPAPEPGADD